MKPKKDMLILPPTTTTENVNDVDESQWEEWSDLAKMTFNYLIELVERNETIMYSTDMFPIQSVENKISLHKIMNAATWNIAHEAAMFLNEQK